MGIEYEKLDRFFYHKIDRGNSAAERWLSDQSPIGKPAVVIFYGQITLEQIRNQQTIEGVSESQLRQCVNFVETGFPDNRDKRCILVVGKKIWFLKPIGMAEERKPDDTEENSRDSLRKLIPVKIVRELELHDAPHILAGIGSNNYLVRGTYREIEDPRNRGNLKAIYSILGIQWKQDWLNQASPASLFECLGSTQLETLVAKIFEEHDCFVPAYRGGSLKGVDIFAYADTPKELDGMRIDSEGVQIQVKGHGDWANPKNLAIPANVWFAGYGYKTSHPDRCLNEDWLIRQTRELQRVQSWLRRSLNWVPPEFLAKFLD